MAAVVASTNTLQAFQDSSQPASQTSSPTSPAPSLQIQQSQPSRTGLLNGSGSAGPSHSGDASVSLEPPAGCSYRDFLRAWSDAHVARWLMDIRCGHHANTFKLNDIRGDVLLELDQVTLKEMGMNSVGDRLRIVNAVKLLRQRCSSANALTSILNRPRTIDHTRNSSLTGDINGGARAVSRRLESGRPAPLHLAPTTGSPELPRLVRDGQDSARINGILRPLPQPSSASSHGTPTTAHSVRTNLPPLPPPPRGQPPLPPTRTPRSLLPPSNLSGRRTPTASDAPPLSSQSGSQGSHLLTPTQGQGGNWTNYGLPSDPRQGIRTPSRSTSPLPFPPMQSQPSRSMSRSPNEIVPHARTSSMSAPTVNSGASKLPIRPTPNNTPHPYASPHMPQHNLSPIAESFTTQRTNTSTPSPPTSTPFRVGTGPFRPATPQHNPSLDDLRRKLVKVSLPDEGKSTTINVADCAGGVEFLEKALKKFSKLSARPDNEGMLHVETEDGGLSVDGWGVYLDYGQEDALNTPLSEGQLLSICHAPPDDPAREYGLSLRIIGRTRRPGTRSPSSPIFAIPDVGDINDLLTPETPIAPTPTPKATKRASSISILSGLGVPIPDKLETSGASSSTLSPSKSPSKKGPSKLHNFFGHRPPSELITNHLAEYFPTVEKKVLERTRRQSMLRASGVPPNRRDSVISWTQPSRSRFSVSTLGSGRTTSPRVSMSSASMTLSLSDPEPPLPPVPPPEADTQSLNDPPRLSLSTDDGHSIELLDDTASIHSKSSKRNSSLHLLPPVAFPSESLADSINFADEEPNARPLSRTTSNASKRMSLITELRSKRDRSDTVSLMTVDEITAEVESRRESDGQETDVDSTDSWTKVEAADDAEKQSLAGQTESSEDEETSDEDDEDDDDEAPEDVPDDATVNVDDEDETGKAFTSHGRERTIKWIKGALIGAGSFGKVYLGMDASTGLLMAVKQVELPTGSAPNEERKKSMLSALEHEIELLKELHHENIVQYHASCLDEDYLNIFLEYVPGGSVTSVLRNYGAFEEMLVRNWVRQILLGLNYLHERDIIHRDIKGANILVDNKGGIKISDFGISKKVEDSLMPGTRAHRPSLQGSVFWMAPEVVKQTAYTQKADIWSVGCLVVEMLTGEHPWAQLTQMQAIFKIGSSAKPTIPADISPEAEDFLKLTFELNHEARPTAAELLKHPWIANQPLPLAPGQ